MDKYQTSGRHIFAVKISRIVVRISQVLSGTTPTKPLTQDQSLVTWETITDQRCSFWQHSGSASVPNLNPKP